MNPEQRARVEAWLRYGQELGLAPYFRDRSTPTPVPATLLEVLPERQIPAMNPQSSPMPPPAVNPSAVVVPKPAAPGPSLFEVMDRVEGDSLERIREDMGECTRCRLHQGRTKIVFGVGNPKAELVF